MSRFAPRRALGRTGFRATAVGAGDLADRALGIEACAEILRRALDAGVNVVDTAPAYEEGLGERIVGAALEGRRDGVFVVDKVDHLDRPVAPQVEESLGRLGLPFADAFVFHGVSRIDAWEALAAAGGRFEELDRCVGRGLARFRGISSHHPDVLLAAISSGRCDIVLMPVGPHVDPRYLLEVLPLARARAVGTVGFKAFGAGMLLADTSGYGRPLDASPEGPRPRLSVAECVRYALSCDPDVALLGLSNPAEQDEAFAAAHAFVPMGAAEGEAVRARAAEAIRGKGRVWWNPGGA